MKQNTYSFIYVILFVVTFIISLGLCGADRRSSRIDDIPIYKDESQHPFGFMRKLPDDSGQTPVCYELLTSDRNKIAKVHIHTVDPKHLWIKLEKDTQSNKEKVVALLSLWRGSPLNSEVMKREITLFSERKK